MPYLAKKTTSPIKKRLRKRPTKRVVRSISPSDQRQGTPMLTPAAAMSPPRGRAIKKARGTAPPMSRSLEIMEKMLQVAKDSEKRCQQLTEMVSQQLKKTSPRRVLSRDTSPAPSHSAQRYPIEVNAIPGTSMGMSQQTPTTNRREASQPHRPPSQPPQYAQQTLIAAQDITESQWDCRTDDEADGRDTHADGDWLTAPPRQTYRQFPPATRKKDPPVAEKSSAAEEAVRLIVDAAQDTKTTRKKGIPSSYVFPFEMVERGEEGKRIKKGDASKDEYTLGLIRLQSEPGFPRDSVPELFQHLEWVLQDNCVIPWPVVRRYSEDIFTRIADGRLPKGWKDPVALQGVRLEALAIMQHLPQTATQSKYPSQKTPAEPRNPYDKATVGIPCSVWNRDTDRCNKAERGESHSIGTIKYAHICGYCANVRHIVASHPESKCYSKKARDRPAATANISQKDF